VLVPRRLRLPAAAGLLLTATALALPSSAAGGGTTTVSPRSGPGLGYDVVGVRRADTWLLSDALIGGGTQPGS
jgi:uncharacterized protein YraI